MHFPGRRKPVPGGCGKNVLFFTPREVLSDPASLELLIVRE